MCHPLQIQKPMRRFSFLKLIPILFICATQLASAVVQAPNAPSNLRVKVLGVNAFQLDWQDNSNNEVGWEIRVGLRSNHAPPLFQRISLPNITSYVISTNDLTDKELDIQLTSYVTEGEKFILSEPSSIVQVRALEINKFDDPTNLTARDVDDGQIRLTWKDNSTSEKGYEIQYRKGSGNWLLLRYLGPGISFDIPNTGFATSTKYSFRVRAYKENPFVVTGYSNVEQATTRAFQAPTKLVATVEKDGAFTFKWKDNSSIESGYEIQKKAGTEEFTTLGEVPADTSNTTSVTGFELDTAYQFRIRGFRLKESGKVYTDFSKVFSTTSSALAKPTDPAAKVLGSTSVKLTWKDASLRESGYEIQHRMVGTDKFTESGSVEGNVKEFIVQNLTPGKHYEFRIRASGFLSKSEFTKVIEALTEDGIYGDLNPPIFYKSSFVYKIGVSRKSALDSFTVTGLPKGFSFDKDEYKIKGTPEMEGVRTITLKAAFKDSRVITRKLVLRIIRPPAAPEIVNDFPSVNVAEGAKESISLANKFADPDTPSAARVATTLGNFDIILYSHATPKTVDNFLDYVDAGSYDHSFFHRSVSNFIIQGGGYRHKGANGFTKITKNDPVHNEPGISNLAGTVAMAKVAGNPDSATSEFFVNVSDSNASNLDTQNEGFTVFGRVAGGGLSVAQQINGLPVGDYEVQLKKSKQTLEDVPMNATIAPTAMDPDLLVKITSVTAAPILQYEVSSEDSSVATAVVDGMNVKITGVANGSTKIQVKATDLDGSSTSQKITVTVP